MLIFHAIAQIIINKCIGVHRVQYVAMRFKVFDLTYQHWSVLSLLTLDGRMHLKSLIQQKWREKKNSQQQQDFNKTYENQIKFVNDMAW